MDNSRSLTDKLKDNPNITNLNRPISDYNEEELFKLQLILEDVIRIKNILKTKPNQLIIKQSKERLIKIYQRILFYIEDLKP